jgi:hypothetical protein
MREDYFTGITQCKGNMRSKPGFKKNGGLKSKTDRQDSIVIVPKKNYRELSLSFLGFK